MLAMRVNHMPRLLREAPGRPDTSLHFEFKKCINSFNITLPPPCVMYLGMMKENGGRRMKDINIELR